MGRLVVNNNVHTYLCVLIEIAKYSGMHKRMYSGINKQMVSKDVAFLMWV